MPKDFPRCYQGDPKLDDCLVRAANEARPFLIKGVPEMSILPIDKIIIPKISIKQGGTNINLETELINVTIYGFDNYIINKYTFDVENALTNMDMSISPVYIESIYKMKGQMFFVPVEGTGQLQMNFTSMGGQIKQISKYEVKNGIKFLVPKNSTMDFKIRGIEQMKISGIFDDNPTFKKAFDTLVADNQNEILEDLSPALQTFVNAFIHDFLTKSVGKIPFDEMFPKKTT